MTCRTISGQENQNKTEQKLLKVEVTATGLESTTSQFVNEHSLSELLSVRLRTKLSGCRFESNDSQRYTNEDLKISLYIQVHVKIIP